jgi:predicted ATPase
VLCVDDGELMTKRLAGVRRLRVFAGPNGSGKSTIKG